ncbi:MAG: hypothetical protein Q3992_01120, partial [Bacteroides sp.]|nr:hypothetical protein [Bacteroides sp.]
GKVKSVRDVYSLQNPQELDSATLAKYSSKEYTYEYNEQGYSIRERCTDSKMGLLYEIKYERDANNRELKTEITQGSHGIKSYQTFVYNDKGQKTKMEISNQDNEVVRIVQISYNRKGFISNLVCKDEKGKVTNEFTYEYDSNGKLVKEVHKNITTEAVSTKEYGKDGTRIDGKLICDESKEAGNVDYDEKGNWIEKRNVANGDKYKEKITRTIEYY